MPRAPKKVRAHPRIFLRWVWLVYLPLLIALAGIGAQVAGLLPDTWQPLLGLFGAWAIFSIRVLLERRRRGVRVAVPKGFISWALGLFLLTSVGGLLFWTGAERLSRNSGMAMLAAGTFLLLLAVAAPLFRLLDLALRAAGRGVRRLLAWSLGEWVAERARAEAAAEAARGAAQRRKAVEAEPAWAEGGIDEETQPMALPTRKTG